MNRLRERVGTRQLLAMALLLLLGAAAALALLRPQEPQAEPAGHAHADGHEAGPAHADGAEAPDIEQDIDMSAAAIQAAGIVLEPARAAQLQSTLQLPGEIRLNEERIAHVVPRVGGVVESVAVSLGQRVEKGQLLAVISSPALSDLRAELQAARRRLQLARTSHEREQRLWEEKISPQQDVLQAEQAWREAEIAEANARQKLQALGASLEAGALGRYELRAPFAGSIVEKHVALGEQLREDAPVLTLSDLRTVWAVLSVPARELPLLREGAAVTVQAGAFELAATGRLAHVGALIDEQSRTAQARVSLDNPDAAWRPGLFVNVGLAGEAREAAVTVAADAVQTLGGRSVVFVRSEHGFRAQPVRLGRSDGRRVEVLDGLAAGAPYVVTGGFVLKSEAGKATATHSH
ncbi:MAG: efflux RND transporter periplasmic adaptor subunit [Roseateles sp.]|nr:MAG: efflux RND transporter periplasmic adaptor subunit [Roseateles sp.]